MTQETIAHIRSQWASKQIHVIPYAHADYAWTHYRRWHEERYILIIQEVLDAMEEHPDYRWMTDNIGHMLVPFFKYCSARLDEFRRRVAEGRLEITNGVHSLVRPTQVGGEAFIRNIVMGRRLLQQMLPGFQTAVFHNVDVSIGHSQMPQVLKLAGYRYYRAWRPQGAMDQAGIPREFMWKGADGSAILTSRGSYAGLCGLNYMMGNMEDHWDEVVKRFYNKELKNIVSWSDANLIWLSYGMDDSRPLRDYTDEPVSIIEFMETWNRKENSSIRFSTAAEYFRGLETTRLTVVEGTLDGCDVGYNTPLKGSRGLWRMRLELERKILKTETLWAMAAMRGENYPEDEIARLWETLLFISGHAMESTLSSDFEHLLKEATSALHTADLLEQDAAWKMARSVESGKLAIVLNTLGWEREEIVPLHLSFPTGGKSFQLIDCSGATLDYQIRDIFVGDVPYKGATFDEATVWVKVTLPAMGHAAIRMREIPLEEQSESMGLEAEHIDFRLNGGSTQTVDTGEIKVVFSNGKIEKVTDLSGNTLFSLSESASGLGDLQFTHVNHHAKAAWLFFSHHQGADFFQPLKWEWEEFGPLQWTYAVSGTLGSHKVKQRIILQKHRSAIQFDVELICSEALTGFYTAAFPTDTVPAIQAGIPFGSEKRNPAAERYGKLTDQMIDNIERTWQGLFYAQEWVGYSNRNRRNSLIGTDTGQYYVHDEERHSLSIVLTRSFDLSRSEDWMKHVHPSAECLGVNSFHYTLVFHAEEEATELAAIKLAKESLFRPIIGQRLNCEPEGGYDGNSQLIKLSGDSVIVSALYKDEGQYIFRAYEAAGVPCKFSLQMPVPLSEVKLTNFVGELVSEHRLQWDRRTGIVEVELAPREIMTLAFRQ